MLQSGPFFIAVGEAISSLAAWLTSRWSYSIRSCAGGQLPAEGSTSTILASLGAQIVRFIAELFGRTALKNPPGHDKRTLWLFYLKARLRFPSNFALRR